MIKARCKNKRTNVAQLLSYPVHSPRVAECRCFVSLAGSRFVAAADLPLSAEEDAEQAVFASVLAHLTLKRYRRPSQGCNSSFGCFLCHAFLSPVVPVNFFPVTPLRRIKMPSQVKIIKKMDVARLGFRKTNVGAWKAGLVT